MPLGTSGHSNHAFRRLQHHVTPRTLHIRRIPQRTTAFTRWTARRNLLVLLPQPLMTANIALTNIVPRDERHKYFVSLYQWAFGVYLVRLFMPYDPKKRDAMTMLLPGLYVDPMNRAHIFPDEICADLDIPYTEANHAFLVEIFRRAAQQMGMNTITTLIHEREPEA